MPPDLTFGEALRAARLKKRETQEEYAARLGIGRVYLSNLERGRQQPSLELVRRAAALIGNRIYSTLKEL